MDNVGEKIRLKRIAKKLSQVELCKKTGISRPTLTKLEKGETVPSLKILRKIAEYLEINVSELIENPDESKEESNDAMVLTSLGEIFNMLEKYAEQPLTEKDKMAFRQILRIVEEKYLDDITPGGID